VPTSPDFRGFWLTYVVTPTDLRRLSTIQLRDARDVCFTGAALRSDAAALLREKPNWKISGRETN
jgi:hypothetical protein